MLAFFIIGAMLEGWFEYGWEAVISYAIIGIAFGLILFFKQRGLGKQPIDIRIDSSGLNINEKGKANHYFWNYFKKVMTNMTYIRIHSQGEGGAYAIGSADRICEAHGRVFLLFYKKENKPNS